MPWVRARFKDKDIWAQVDDGGQLAVEGGRVPIRYSKSASAKIYRAGASRISVADGQQAVEIAGGVSADAAPAKKDRGSGFGSAGTRTAAQATAAKQSAQQIIAALPEGTHKAFTDGACKGNPGPCGAGAVLVHAGGEVTEDYLALGQGTNNIGELAAIGLALDLLEQAGVDPAEPVVIFTDSKYSDGVLTRGWKAKANRALIGGLKSRLARWPNLRLQWIAGHVGIAENERADRLAVRGVEESRRR